MTMIVGRVARSSLAWVKLGYPAIGGGKKLSRYFSAEVCPSRELEEPRFAYRNSASRETTNKMSKKAATTFVNSVNLSKSRFSFFASLIL